MPIAQVPAHEHLEPERLERLRRDLQIHRLERRVCRRHEADRVARRKPPRLEQRPPLPGGEQVRDPSEARH